jgi:hypothetical protein
MDDAPDPDPDGTSDGERGPRDADGLPDRVAEHWAAVVADVEATAEEYREAGAEVVELHPADVVARPDLGGFTVPVPAAEFEALRTLVGTTELPLTDLYRARAGDVAFVAAMLTAADGSAAVCCPLFYDIADEDARAVERDSRESGALRAFVAPADDEGAVVLQFDDPDVFFGDGSDGDGTDDADETDASGDDADETDAGRDAGGTDDSTAGTDDGTR